MNVNKDDDQPVLSIRKSDKGLLTPAGPERANFLLVQAIQLVWAVLVVAIATVLGATYGWEHHGIIGGVALGFAGLVVGAFLSSPSVLLQLVS